MLRQFKWSRSALLGVMIGAAGLVTVPCNAEAADDQSVTEQAASDLPSAKQTTLGLYVTSKEAYEKWQAAPDNVTIVDVRTPEEFIFIGHPEMALNIPIATQSLVWDTEKNQFPMQMTPDFVSRVQQIANPDDTLLVMCRSGGRSAIAVNMLAKAGFRNVYNITDGMEGDSVKDPNSVYQGQRLVNGWKNSGVPWTYKVKPDQVLLPAAPPAGK